MSAPTPRVAPWEDVVLRIIAVYKLLHAVFFVAVGLGLFKLRRHNMVDFLNQHLIIPYHLNPEQHFVDWMLGQAAKVTPHMLLLLGYVSFIYAALFAAEGIGLYLRKHWAEWLVVVVTGSLLPFELYELWLKIALWKIAAVVGNVLIVGYLIHRITLDARLKAKALRAEAARNPAGPAADHSGTASAPGNRVESAGSVPTKMS